MMRRLILPASLVLLAACRSAVAPAPATTTPAAPAHAAARAAADAAGLDWHQRVEALLDDAEAAAENGATDDYDVCAADLVAVLSAARQRPDLDIEDRLAISEALDELQRLDEMLAANGEEAAAADQEAPPEPGPVAESTVAATREKASREAYDLPVVVNSDVTSLISYYTGPYRDRFVLAMQRGSRYLKEIRASFRAAGLPEDLAYLPLVESAFNPRARSRARAQGLWQFIRGTASLYGLRCDGLVDERNDPYLATRAAIAHLTDLHAAFGDWELALAAYNSGEGRVERALRRARGTTTNFWALRRFLPRETRNYVPAFWAALVVAKDPANFGLPAWQDGSECLGRVPVEGALDLDVLAEHVSLTSDQLADLNPALIHRLTAPRGTYQLAVPCGQEDAVRQALAAIPKSERVRRFIHTVTGGDTLGALARRYGSTVPTIMAANGIRDPRRLKIGQRLVIPRGSWTGRAATTTVTADAARPSRYVVRRGDTLYGIARRFGLSVPELQRTNGLDGPDIRPGDVLRLP